MKLSILFYHPKNPQNLADIASIASAVGAKLYVVQRPGADYNVEALPADAKRSIVLVSSVEEVVSREYNPLFIVLETYGEKLITDVEFRDDENIVLVLGAEDYGFPRAELEKLPRRVTVLIPVAVEGMSYNVVSSLVMALYEIARRRGLASKHGERYGPG